MRYKASQHFATKGRNRTQATFVTLLGLIIALTFSMTPVVGGALAAVIAVVSLAVGYRIATSGVRLTETEVVVKRQLSPSIRTPRADVLDCAVTRMSVQGGGGGRLQITVRDRKPVKVQGVNGQLDSGRLVPVTNELRAALGLTAAPPKT